MANQASTTIRNNFVTQVESTVGTSPRLQLRSGAQPADCAAADSGTLLVEITLPSDWLSAAASGAVSKSGTWEGTAAASGTAGHYRLKDSAGTTTHFQGSVGAGSGDLQLNSTSISSSQVVTISAASFTAGNA